ncbi:MAG TPA: hypothetical protein ENI99_03465 [Sedimenticola sp.]|nr:hypothetical protein [Sedimenticola sp.]
MKRIDSKQEGAILIWALVLLLILTILSTTSFQEATMEERMAASQAQHTVAFMSAENAIEELLNNTSNLSAAAMSSVAITVEPDFDSAATIDAEAQVEMTRLSNSSNSSLQYNLFNFNIVGTGRLQRSDGSIVAETTINHGVQWLKPVAN